MEVLLELIGLFMKTQETSLMIPTKARSYDTHENEFDDDDDDEVAGAIGIEPQHAKGSKKPFSPINFMGSCMLEV